MADNISRKRTQISFNLDQSLYEKFVKLYAQRKTQGKTTQTQLFGMMIDAYEKSVSPEADQSITLLMYLRTPSMVTPTQKMTFSGIRSHACAPRTKPLDDATAHNLSKDFRCTIKYPHAYTYTHHLELYYHKEKQSYMVREEISLSKRQDYLGEMVRRFEPEYESYFSQQVIPSDFHDNPLEVSRFRLVANAEEFDRYFGRYADRDEWIECSAILANEIGDNCDLIDELFP